MLIEAIAIQTTSSPQIPAGRLPAAAAMALIGMPSAIEPSAIAVTWNGLGRGAADCGYAGPRVAATRASTRASTSLLTFSRKESTTAFWYSGPSSRCVSAAARISSGDNDEPLTRQDISYLGSRRISLQGDPPWRTGRSGDTESRGTARPRFRGDFARILQRPSPDLTTHRAECSSTPTATFTVRDVSTPTSTASARHGRARRAQSRDGRLVPPGRSRAVHSGRSWHVLPRRCRGGDG